MLKIDMENVIKGLRIELNQAYHRAECERREKHLLEKQLLFFTKQSNQVEIITRALDTVTGCTAHVLTDLKLISERRTR